MAIDSKVAFQNRAVELGIAQADVDALSDSGIHSMQLMPIVVRFNLAKQMTLP